MKTMKKHWGYILIICILFQGSWAQQKPAFQMVPLGVNGGIDESNLSAYLVAPVGSNDYVCLDAGTVYAGIEKAISNKVFDTPVLEVLQNRIKGYLISHAHLDHVSGLIIVSPADASKTVYAAKSTMQMMQNHYFNGETWANFGDEGPGYQIKKYHFQTLGLGKETPLFNTTMTVKAFSLSHVSPFESTAFLIRSNKDYVLYLGDTGPDAVENSTDLKELWQAVAPLIKTKQLRAIFIESSFPNEQLDQALFGHLTPKWLMKEMEGLSALTGKKALKGFKLIITHLKPPTESIQKIKKQLKEENKFEFELIFPEQGKRLEL